MAEVSRCLARLAMVLGAGLLFSACMTSAAHGMKDPKNRESYSLGYQLGQNLKNQNVDVDFDVYLSGVRDALEGKKAQLSPSEIHATLSDIGARLKSTMQEGLRVKAEKNLAEGKSFLEANKNAAGVTVLPSGLQYRILKQGTGRKPREGDTVTVQYRGAFTNGAEFANSYQQNRPTTGSLRSVIPGWREALQLMKEGSRYQLFIPPGLAYGQNGAPGIEPNRTLVFDLELISLAPASGNGPELKPVAAHSRGR